MTKASQVSVNLKQPRIEITEDFEALLSEYLRVQTQKTIDAGRVIDVNDKMVVVDIGGKSEASIPIQEFIGDNVQQNQLISVAISSAPDGSTALSRERAKREEAWERIAKKVSSAEYVYGYLKGRVKGGFAVELVEDNDAAPFENKQHQGFTPGSIVAFLPGSQVDIRPVKDMPVLFNCLQTFRVLKMDHDNGNVVVSRRAVAEESRKEGRDKLFGEISVGTKLVGTVKNITDYGAFIDLGPTDGLLHITDMSWYKITHPSQILKIGQEVEVVVIQYSVETQRISLGLKQLTANPWEQIKDKYQPGTRHKGKVVAITDYGAFVSLEQNVDGLVYHTEIHWTARNLHPSKLLKIDDVVDVCILDIDIARHRISLSMKRCHPNPWEEFALTHKPGTQVELIVRDILELGLFAVFPSDEQNQLALRIMIPTSELNFGETEVTYKQGDRVSCMITNVDVQKERIVASMRHNDIKMFALYRKYERGELVQAKVIQVNSSSIDVQPMLNIEQLPVISISEQDLSRIPEQQNVSLFVVGDIINIRITAIDLEAKTVSCVRESASNSEQVI